LVHADIQAQMVLTDQRLGQRKYVVMTAPDRNNGHCRLYTQTSIEPSDNLDAGEQHDPKLAAHAYGEAPWVSDTAEAWPASVLLGSRLDAVHDLLESRIARDLVRISRLGVRFDDRIELLGGLL
jgi:hypothetical protein